MSEMDSWSVFQIQCMWNGGNIKFKEFLEGYGLNQEYSQTRYRTVAAAYYRRWLMSQALAQEFNEAQPEYNEGQKQMPTSIFKKQEGKNDYYVGGYQQSTNQYSYDTY